MTSELEAQLAEIEDSLIIAPATGLAHKVKAKLISRLEGTTTADELEQFLAQKINLTVLNLDKLEATESPQSATELHSSLHTAFILYEEALVALEDFLFEQAEPSEVRLEEVFSILRQGDHCLQLFEGELDDRLAPLAGINTLW